MKNDNPLRISVVMAVWNAERYLEEALASIAAQTCPPAEVLLVDGGSTDGTPAIASRFEWVRFLPQRDRGLSDAWNTGVQTSSGDAIAFLDSDDRWVADKLRLQAEHLALHPEADAVIGKVHFFLQEGEAPPPGFRTSLLEGSYLAAMPGTTLLRRAAFDRVGDFDVGLNVATDIEWFARARDRGLRMDPLQEVLLHKRVHGGNLSYTSARSDNYERDLLRAIHRLRVERRRPPGGDGS